ncbi:MAG: hypothetical protein JRJ29_16565 [Deltaproteobacteria bacterium]|nr:hypothetical protein [Deltaproteobacteria bacterium]
MKAQKFFLLIIGIIALLLLSVPGGRAQGDDLATLRKKAAQLEQRVKELEGLLEECERTREEAIGAALGWQSKKNWRKLKAGMKESQVKSILGEPSKIIHGAITLWYYPNIYGGYVSFDKKGKLVGWNEP